MSGAGFPPCWLFGLRRPSTGGYRLFGGANGGLWEGSCQRPLPRTSAASVLVPRVSHSHPRLCRRPSNTSREVWFSLLWGHCSFPWVTMSTLLCVCPPRVESLFPPVLSKSCNQIPLAFKVWFLEFLLPLTDPQFGKPDMRLRTFIPVSGLLWYNCSPVCESPTQWLWDLILLWLHPSYHLIAASLLSLDVGYLFWWVPASSCDDCSAVSCDSSALARGSEHTSFYSAILNQSPPTIYFLRSG